MSRPELLTGREKKDFPLFSVLVTIILSLIIALFIFEMWFLGRYTPVNVDGNSMLQTLNNGDWLYADSHAEPKRGDIVIIDVSGYKLPSGGNLFPVDQSGHSYIIKRVIALEGDEIYGEDNRIYLKKKGETEFSICEEPYAYYNPSYYYPLSFGSEIDPVMVGEGEIFVMGDNRLDSYDSTEQEIGPLRIKDVTGVVPDWAVERKDSITKWERFRDSFRNHG